MFDWKLDRPLAVFDIEATGISPRADRIVELAIVRLNPDGTRDSKRWMVNPTIPIPEEAIAIHGITNEAVAECPTFKDIAAEVAVFLTNCDLAGFNHTRFDIPMLQEEYIRIKMPFDVDNRRILDAQRIFHQKEPRDLTAAVRFYCNETFADAHGALADTEATLRVIEGQLERYPDLPRDIDGLDQYCNPRDPFWADRTGRLRWVDGEIALNFSKKKGQTLRDLVLADPGFLKWILRNDFPRDTQKLVDDALKGVWPEPPAVTAKSDPTKG